MSQETILDKRISNERIDNIIDNLYKKEFLQYAEIFPINLIGDKKKRKDIVIAYLKNLNMDVNTFIRNAKVELKLEKIEFNLKYRIYYLIVDMPIFFDFTVSYSNDDYPIVKNQLEKKLKDAEVGIQYKNIFIHNKIVHVKWELILKYEKKVNPIKVIKDILSIIQNANKLYSLDEFKKYFESKRFKYHTSIQLLEALSTCWENMLGDIGQAVVSKEI